MARMIFSAPTYEEALERASTELKLPTSALEAQVLDDDRHQAKAPGEAGVCVRVRVSRQYLGVKAREILEGLLAAMEMEGQVVEQVDRDAICLEVSAPRGSILIGREGHTLDAIQHWVSRALAHATSSTPSLVIDVEGYRGRKFDKLEKMVRRIARRVASSGQSVKLPVMGPTERKFIHNALKDFDGVSTFSVGREGKRYVVVGPAGEEALTKAEVEAEEAEADARPYDRGEPEETESPETDADEYALPEDDLISDRTALTELGVVAKRDVEPAGAAGDRGGAAPFARRRPAVQPAAQDEEDKIEDELH